MAVMRPPQTCFKCGGTIEAKHWKPNPALGFCGDTFIGWDYESHVCPKTILLDSGAGAWRIKYKKPEKLINNK